MKQGVFLSKTWVNSQEEIDGWSLEIAGEKVNWNYDALFDSSTYERSHGDASFSCEGFKRFLQQFLEEGDAWLNEDRNFIRFTKKENEVQGKFIQVFVSGYGDSLGYPMSGELPDEVFEAFDIEVKKP